MSGRYVLTFTTIALGVGLALGAHGKSDTEVKVVPKPQVIEKIVTVPTIQIEEKVVTVIKYKPLPRSCLDAFEITRVMHANDKIISDQAGLLEDQLQQLNPAIFGKNFKTINDLTQVTRDSRNLMNTAILAKLSQVDRLDKLTAQCNIDRAK